MTDLTGLPPRPAGSADRLGRPAQPTASAGRLSRPPRPAGSADRLGRPGRPAQPRRNQRVRRRCFSGRAVRASCAAWAARAACAVRRAALRSCQAVTAASTSRGIVTSGGASRGRERAPATPWVEFSTRRPPAASLFRRPRRALREPVAGRDDPLVEVLDVPPHGVLVVQAVEGLVEVGVLLAELDADRQHDDPLPLDELLQPPVGIVVAPESLDRLALAGQVVEVAAVHRLADLEVDPALLLLDPRGGRAAPGARVARRRTVPSLCPLGLLLVWHRVLTSCA